MIKTISRVTMFLFIVSLLFSCAKPEIVSKPAPEYEGVAKAAQPIVDEYLWLSRQKHIKFDDKVTIGFKKINAGLVVGICTFGGWFREIDIDINYWNNTTKVTHTTLLFHELTHCYCGRDHDYGENKNYPEKESDRILQALAWRAKGGPRPGFYDDGCPVSFMYPVVLDDDCTLAHYNDYVQEMFDRCDAF